MSLPSDVQLLQRDFANNSFAYLFEDGPNTAELVRWIQPTIAGHLDLSEIKKESEKFQAPSFKQLECDVLLSAPGRGRRAKASPFQVYILIEHQSEPDPQMVYRALRYVVQIHDRQQQAWSQRHSNTRDLLFDPVLPIVVYAGTKRWPRLLPIREVVHHADLFGPMIPEIAPRFVNLRETDSEVLRTQVGFIGWVLWLIQQQQQPVEEFEEILRQVVAAVNPLAAREQARGTGVRSDEIFAPLKRRK